MKTQGKIWIIYSAESKTQSKPMSVVQAQVALLSIPASEHHAHFIWTPGWEKWVSIRDYLDSEQTDFVMVQPPEPDIPPVADNTVTKTKAPPSAVKVVDSAYTQVLVGDVPLRPQDIGGYHSRDFNGDELNLASIKKLKIKAENNAPKSASAPSVNVPDEAKMDAERRRSSRHNFKIEVVLVSKLRSFRTYSQNISLSGTLLEQEIPRDFLNQPFDLIIVNPFEANPSKARLLFRAKIVGDHKDPRRLMFVEEDANMTAHLDALLKAYVAYQEQIRKNAV